MRRSVTAVRTSQRRRGKKEKNTKRGAAPAAPRCIAMVRNLILEDKLIKQMWGESIPSVAQGHARAGARSMSQAEDLCVDVAGLG